jgi:hypothetical protein
MMGTIYQYAQTIFVWLGCEADGSPKVSTETRDLVKGGCSVIVGLACDLNQSGKKKMLNCLSFYPREKDIYICMLVLVCYLAT